LTIVCDRSSFSNLRKRAKKAENLRVRARLIAPLVRYVREQGLNQTGVAQQLATTQARTSELM
jgi:predicted XRE-type DNA-binding protein